MPVHAHTVWRRVTAAVVAASPSAKLGRILVTGVSQVRSPRSASTAMSSVVSDLVVDPIMKRVVGVTGLPVASERTP
jgi:hypothetical protein